MSRTEAREPTGRLAKFPLERDLCQIARDREMIRRGLREIGEERLEHRVAVAAAAAHLPRQPAERSLRAQRLQREERNPGRVQIRDVSERGDGAAPAGPPA